MKRLLRFSAWSVGILCIALALASIALRLALPHVDGLRETLSARLTELLGVDVRMGGLSARLSGLTLVLTLNDAQLIDPGSGEPLLGLKELRLTLDPLASLRAGQPRIDGLTLVGAELAVQRGADGRIGLRGLDALVGGNNPDALEFFLREGRFSLADTTLYFTDAMGRLPTLGLVVERLDFTNRGQRHRLRLHAHLPGDPVGTLTVLGRLHGPGQAFDHWSGALWLDWNGDPGRALHGLLPAGLTVGARATRLRVWQQFADGRLELAVAELAATDLHIRRRGADKAVIAEGRFPRLSALARLRGERDAWRLDIADLVLTTGAGSGQATDLALALGRPTTLPGTAPQTLAPGELTLRSGPLPLGPAASLAGLLAPAVVGALPVPLAALLAAPIDGWLETLALRIAPPAAAGTPAPTPRDWRLRLAVADLDLPAVAPWPALRDLNLALDTGPTHGTGRLAAADLDLDLRPWLARRLQITRLDADLDWRRAADGAITISTPALVAHTEALKTVTRALITLRPGTTPFVDLHTHAWDGDVARAPDYLPVKVMAPELVDWLNQALVGGRLTSGDVLLRGSLADFPFDGGRGRFLIDLRMADGVLDYAPARDPASLKLADPLRARANALGWPRLEDLTTTLRIDARALTIEVDAGRILHTTIDGGTALLPNLWRPRTIEIEARGHGPLTDGQRVLAETPASYNLGGVAKALAVTGETALKLKLSVPLKRELAYAFTGDLTLGRAVTLRPLATNLTFTDISGALRFDPTGIVGDGLKANLDGQALQVAVASPEGATEITLTGTTPVADLARRWPNPLWSMAEGQGDWRLLLVLDHGALRLGDAATTAPLLFTLTSDLRGVALSPPAPIGKAADPVMPLRAVLPWTGRWPLGLQVTLGEAGARLQVEQGPRIVRVALSPSGLPAGVPERPGVAIDGQVGEVALEPWIAWFAAGGPFGDHPPATAAGDGPLPLLPIGLRAARVTYGPLAWRDVDARIAPLPGAGFVVDFKAADGGGQVRLPASASTTPINVHLSTLDVAPFLNPPTAPRPGDPATADPRHGPTLALEIDTVKVAERSLGRLQAVLEPRPDGLSLKQFKLVGPLIDASGSGAWSADSTDFRRTAIDLRAVSSDIGELLRTGGFYSELAEAPGKVALQLNWPGDPGDFELARSRGTLGLDIGAGRLLAVEPGVGRMLGVLNLSALRRRLSLDFDDLFETGFNFDSLRGNIVIGGGQARIADLALLASAADIRISGLADLDNGTLNQTVRVTPKLGAGLVIAGTVAGGPLVGAAAWLVDKAAGGAVDRLAAYEYRVTGPWRTPEVGQVGGVLPSPAPGATNGKPGKPPPAPTPPANPFLDGG